MRIKAAEYSKALQRVDELVKEQRILKDAQDDEHSEVIASLAKRITDAKQQVRQLSDVRLGCDQVENAFKILRGVEKKLN